MAEFFTSLSEWLQNTGARYVGIVVFLIFAWGASFWLKRIVVRALTPTRVDATLTKFFASASRWVVLVFAILTCLNLVGIETTSYAAVIAAGGVAVGLAFQGTLNNFACGLMLLVLRPFKVGDTVRIAGELGSVDEVALFSTRIDTFDKRRIVIPNSAVFGTKIENLSYHPQRRVEVAVGVDYDADIDRTREVLESAAAAIPEALDDPPAQVLLLALGDSAVDWEVRVWAKSQDMGAVKQATIRAVKQALDQAGIGIPYPQLQIHRPES